MAGEIVAIIWREKREIKGTEYPVSIFKSDSPIISETERKKAEELDKKIMATMRKIEKDISALSLNKERGARDVKYWFELGKRLAPLFESGDSPDEKDIKYLWKAVYDWAPDLFTEGRQERFIYAAVFIGKLPWDAVKDTIWTEWVDFCDIRVIREYSKVREWIISKTKKYSSTSQQNWTRKLIKEISATFKKKDLSVFTEEEIISKLESIFFKIHGQV